MNIFVKRPLLRVLLTTIAGIMIAPRLPGPSPWSLLLLLLGWIFLFFLNRLRAYGSFKVAWWINLCVHGCLLFAVVLYFQLRTNRASPDTVWGMERNDYSFVLATVENRHSGVSEWDRYVVKLMALKDSTGWHSIREQAEIVMKRSVCSIPEAGDLLALRALFRPVKGPLNPGAFDYKAYLARKDIFCHAFLDTSDYAIISKGYRMSLKEIASGLKADLLRNWEKYVLSAESTAVLKALLLGDKGELDQELKGAYASAGLMHVMAVSGLHVGTIYVILNFLFAFFNNYRPGQLLRALLIGGVLWGYAFITGLSPSVLRACIMMSLVLIAQLIDNRADTFNLLAASAILLLLAYPSLLTDVGFQLSYTAVIGILLFYPLFYRMVSWRWSWMDKIWSLACVSIAAQLGTTPLSIYYFHQFPLYFLPANLLIVPLVLMVFYLGILFLACSWWTGIASFLALLLNHAIGWLNTLVMLVERLPASLISNLYLSFSAVWLLYIAIISAAIVWIFRSRSFIFITLLALLLLTWDRIAWVKDCQEQRRIVLYAIRGHRAIDFISGRQHLTIVDSLAMADQSKIVRQADNHWTRSGLTTHHFEVSDNLQGNSSAFPLLYSFRMPPFEFYEFSGCRILVCREKAKLPSVKNKFKIDYLLLSGNAKLSMKEIEASFSYKQIIFDLTNSSYRVTAWINSCKAAGIAYHDMNTEGAMVISL